MKKLLVLILLSISGALFAETKMFSKRAWACRNHRHISEDYLGIIGGHFNPKAQDERLEKNNCTPEEIKAGEKLQNAIDLGVKMPVGFAAMVGVTLGIEAIGGMRAKKDRQKITAKYGENWESRCAEIAEDTTMPQQEREKCQLMLVKERQRKARIEARKVKAIKTQKTTIREGGGQWSGQNPLFNKAN